MKRRDFITRLCAVVPAVIAAPFVAGKAVAQGVELLGYGEVAMPINPACAVKHSGRIIHVTYSANMLDAQGEVLVFDTLQEAVFESESGDTIILSDSHTEEQITLSANNVHMQGVRCR